MSHDDRTLWNDRYRAGEHDSLEPTRLLVEVEHLLPRTGRAIDVAGGTGRNARWLARRGLDVTVADTSDVALQMVRNRAAAENLIVSTQQVDLETEPFPDGPWDLVVIVHYLWRPLLATIPSVLAPGGIFVCIHPTKSNLTRYSKPSARFLLEDGELPTLVSAMKTIYYREGWQSDGRHEAILVASV